MVAAHAHVHGTGMNTSTSASISIPPPAVELTPIGDRSGNAGGFTPSYANVNANTCNDGACGGPHGNVGGDLMSPSMMASTSRSDAEVRVGPCLPTDSRDGPTGTVTFCGELDADGCYGFALRRRLADGDTGNVSRLRLCGGLCDMLIGPHGRVFAASNVMIVAPTLVFAAVTSVSFGVVLFALALAACSLWALWRTASADPGILHRGPPLPDSVATPRAVEVILPLEASDALPTTAPPPSYGERPRSTVSRQFSAVPVPLQRRWCFTCNILRPLRASHCEFCGVCVERRDHHCPWTGTCIGRRNYPYFVLFLCLTSLALLVCVTASIFSLVGRARAFGIASTAADGDSALAPTVTSRAERSRGLSGFDKFEAASAATHHIEVVLILYAVLMLVFVGSLAAYHVNLSRLNLTTREDLRKEFARAILVTEASAAAFQRLREGGSEGIYGDGPAESEMAQDRIAAVVYNPFDKGSWRRNAWAVLVEPIHEELRAYARELSEGSRSGGASRPSAESDRRRLNFDDDVDAHGRDSTPPTPRAPAVGGSISSGAYARAAVDRLLCCFDRFAPTDADAPGDTREPRRGGAVPSAVA